MRLRKLRKLLLSFFLGILVRSSGGFGLGVVGISYCIKLGCIKIMRYRLVEVCMVLRWFLGFQAYPDFCWVFIIFVVEVCVMILI